VKKRVPQQIVRRSTDTNDLTVLRLALDNLARVFSVVWGEPILRWEAASRTMLITMVITIWITMLTTMLTTMVISMLVTMLITRVMTMLTTKVS